MAAENRGPEFAALLIVFLIFVTIPVIGRYITARFLLKRVVAEDWLAFATWLIYVAYTVVSLLSVHWGLGQHVIDVSPSQHPTALFYKWLGQILGLIVAVFVRFVTGLLLLRICSHAKPQRWTIYILMGAVVLFNAFLIFIFIFQCLPVRYYWFRYTSDSITGKCNNSKLALIPTYASFVVNVVADWTLALLPVSFVWNSKMEIRTKISVCGILALGIFASIATVVRIFYARQILSNKDYLYNFTDFAIWSTIEVALALAASSMATLKPLFRKLKILLPTRSSSHHTIGTGDSPYNSQSNGTGSHSRSRSLGKFMPKVFADIRHGSTDHILENGRDRSKMNTGGGHAIELQNIRATTPRSVENEKYPTSVTSVV